MFNRNNPQKLINSWESLTHRDRVTEMIELGKQEASDSDVSNLLDRLQEGNYYERMLALYSCYGSYNESRVLTAIKDDSRSIKNKAIKLISLVKSDRAVLTALDNLNYRQCIFLFSCLRNRKRYAIIDSCLQKLSDRLEQQRVDKLLAFGTTDFVKSNLAKILERAGIEEWSRLGKYHPEVCLDALEEYASETISKDWRFVGCFNTVIPKLAELYPDRVLNIVRDLSDRPYFEALNFSNLMYYRPIEVAKLVLQIEDEYRINLNPVAHKLPPNVLINLIDRQPHTVDRHGSWLPKLSPNIRVEIYQHCNSKWRDSKGCLSPNIIELLPTAVREKEARLSINSPDLATRPNERLAYATFLPWDETLSIIQPYLKNPDADLRILALKTIINATKYCRSSLLELLKAIEQRKNEQDPVRNAMLYSLAELPPGIWQESHLASLDIIFKDALQAADLSNATRNHVQHLVVKILPFHCRWSAQWLRKFVAARGRIKFDNFVSRLNDSQVKQVAPILLPVFKSWSNRESEWNIIEAAYSFGKRLEVFDGLVDILESILLDATNIYTASRVLNILSQYRRDRLAYLIPQLLKKDRSWATRPVVSNYLHNFRQDLLTPYLGQTLYKGRFATGKTYFVPYFNFGFGRWTYTQQTIYARTLVALTRDSDRDIPTVWSAIARLALLPAIEQTRLIQLASIDNPHEATRDRAIRALARLDSGQGIPILLSALEDERVRIAIYALRKCLLEMPVDKAVTILKNVDSQKVTVNKEIVRLLGDLDSDAAYQELLAKTSNNLHRDVRIASLRALWEHLEKAETWSTLEQAARDTDEAVATMVGRTPGDKLSEAAQARLISLIVTLLNRPEATLRLTILQRCYQLPVRDSAQILLPQLLKSLNSDYSDEVKAAADAIFITYSDTETIVKAIATIIPKRRSLNRILSSWQYRLSGYSEEKVEMVSALLAVLANDPLTVFWQIKLAVASLTGNKLSEFLFDLNNKGQLHPDALTTAEKAIYTASYHPDLEQIEATLAKSEDEKLRRLALSALMAQRNRFGWNRAIASRLLAYRQDSSILVAAAAEFIFPPDNLI